MKILITGSNGLLGQKLVQLILEKGNDLVATARGENRLPIPEDNYSYRSLDITDKDQVLQVIGEENPDVVIHTAAMTNVDQCETEREGCRKLNVDAVEYIIKACEHTGAYLLHLSTDFIFDGEAGPYDENGIPNPVSFYGESKLAAEKLLFDSNIKYGIARTVLVYGTAHDMSRSNIFLWVNRRLEAGKDINVVVDELRESDFG